MTFQRLRCGMELKFADDEAKVGTFTGYGSVFNVLDHGGDMIVPGAFKKTLSEWKKTGGLPKMLLQHGGFFGPAEDGIPIGKYTRMEEDTKGLYLEGELFALDTQKGKYIHEGMKSGALDGLSIGYQAVDVTYGKKPEEPRRTLKGVKLFEVSVVTFGMNQDALIDSAKSIDLIKSPADAEDWLRDVVGLSLRQAKTFLSRAKGLSPSDSDGDDDMVSHLRRAVSKL